MSSSGETRDTSVAVDGVSKASTRVTLDAGDDKLINAKNNSFQDKDIRPAVSARDESRTAPIPSPPSQSPSSSHPSYQQLADIYPYSYVAQSPNSPTSLPTTGYDIQALLLQQQVAAGTTSFGRQQYGNALPPRSTAQTQGDSANSINENVCNISMGIIPPASTNYTSPTIVFPGSNFDETESSRINNSSMINPSSISLQYVSGLQSPSASGYDGMYTGYIAGSTVLGNSTTRTTNSPDQQTWSDNGSPVHQPHIYQASTSTQSPLMQQQGIPIQYPTDIGRNRRSSSSFDEMLPPSVINNCGTVFSQEQWGYNQTTDPYSTSLPSQQHHLHVSQQFNVLNRHGRNQQERSNHNAQNTENVYYTATTPGPPIQTTTHNKGPDGANLFIFHIPNHFTNLDLWHLFFHYGSLLSVRIMVEKDTGRSRGFGFVSYDSPEAAALAIKELNGFVIGNKRLKVQHKQIKGSDRSNFPENPLKSQSLFSSNGSRDITSSVPSSNTAALDESMRDGVGDGNWLDGTDSIEEFEGRIISSDKKVIPGSTSQPRYNSDMLASDKDTSNIAHALKQEESPLASLGQLRDALPDV